MFFLMIRRPPESTQSRSSAASDVYKRQDVSRISLRGIDTVVMNPPFGAQKASAGDRAFLSRAIKTAKTVYSLHNRGSERFIRAFVQPCTVQEVHRLACPLKRSFEFHSRSVKTIEVELYRISC